MKSHSNIRKAMVNQSFFLTRLLARHQCPLNHQVPDPSFCASPGQDVGGAAADPALGAAADVFVFTSPGQNVGGAVADPALGAAADVFVFTSPGQDVGGAAADPDRKSVA